MLVLPSKALAQQVRVDAGDRDVGDEAEDDQHREDERELGAHLRLSPGVDQGLEEAGPLVLLRPGCDSH